MKKKEIRHLKLFYISFRKLYFKNLSSKDWNHWGSSPWNLVTFFSLLLFSAFPIYIMCFHFLFFPKVFIIFFLLPLVTSTQHFTILLLYRWVICFILPIVSNTFKHNACNMSLDLCQPCGLYHIHNIAEDLDFSWQEINICSAWTCTFKKGSIMHCQCTIRNIFVLIRNCFCKD